MPLTNRSTRDPLCRPALAQILAAALVCAMPARAEWPPLGATPAPTPARTEPGVPARTPVPELADPRTSPLLDRHYLGADPRTWPPVLAPARQEVFDRRFRIVHEARTHPGMRVADIGSDSGALAVLFARAAGPTGRVYAVTDRPSAIAELQGLARTYRVANLVPILATEQGTGLAGGSIDLAFLGNGYRRLGEPRALLDSIYQALVPYGTLIVVERRPTTDDPADGAPADPRGADASPVGRERAVSEIEAAGFKLVDAPDLLGEHDFLRFEKVGDEPDLEVGPIEDNRNRE
jgi:SAM-dependent methyltransferase